MPNKYYLRNFHPGYYYHIYNRGAFKQNIFLDDQDYNIFLDIIAFYLKSPSGKPQSLLNRQSTNKKDLSNKGPTLAKANSTSFEVSCFCLMPNHFHFLIKQLTQPTPTTNISNFMKRLGVTYALYFIEKYKHSGSLFQGKYKNILIETESQLLYLTKYIHLNPKVTNPLLYPYSSYLQYVGKQKIEWLSPSEILAYFSKTNPRQSYTSFIKETSKLPDNLEYFYLDD